MENPAVPLWSPAAYNYLGAPRSSAGVAVDRHTVLSYPAVWRAISLVAGKIGRLPLNVYRHNPDGGRTIDQEHPAQWLLAKRPSSLYTPKVFKQTLLTHALLYGNGYAWIIRDTYGKPTELLLLNPESTGVALTGGQLYYFFRVGTDTRKLLPENVLHVKGLSYDGLLGISVIDAMREAFGLGLAAQRYGSVFFRNNGSPGPMILKFPGKLDKEQRQHIREEWDKLHVGLDNAHRYAILANNGDFAQFKVDNDTAQFIQTREFEVACGIASIFGIPAHKLGVPRNDGYNSLEQQEQAFTSDTLDTWLVEIEEECESKLLKESQQIRDSHFVEFDRHSLEQTDYRTRSDTLIQEVNNGIRTQNEARALLNLPSAGADGDRQRMPVNITFIDTVNAADDILSDTPGQPAEQTVGSYQDTKEPVPDSPVPDDPARAKLAALLTADVDRLLTRLRKAVQAAAEKPGFTRWLDAGLEQHRAVMVEALSPVSDSASSVVDAFLLQLREELAAITSDLAPAAMARYTPDSLVRQLL